MQVKTHLQMLSDATKNEIIKEQNKRLDKNVESLLEDRLTDGLFIRELWERLHDIERKAAQLFMVETSYGFFSKKQWDAVAVKRHAHLTLGLTALRRLGLVFTVRKLWSEIGYVMPTEVREMISAFTCSSVNIEAVPHELTQTLTYYMTAGRGIHLDFIGFLRFVAEHDIALTQKHTIPRRFTQKLLPMISFGENHVFHWYEQLFPSEIRNSYSPSVAILLDLALRLQLVQMIDKKLILQEENVMSWLVKKDKTRWEELFHIFISYYIPSIPWLEAFVFEMKKIVDSEWYTVASILISLEDRGFFISDDATELVVQQWLHPLLGAGFILLGRDEENRLLWRWNPLVVQTNTQITQWYIEPTGVIVVPPLVSLDAIWELARVAELSFEGEIIRCTLSLQKVQMYIAEGGTEEQLTSFLQQNCPYPVPEQVLGMIREWAKGARQIRFETVIRVHTASPAILQELMQIPLLQPFMTCVISDKDFLIDISKESGLIKALRQCGYEPQAGKIERARPVLKANELAINHEQTITLGTGLFTRQLQWEGYQVENIFPDRYESIPQLALLPKMWTQHYQSYHPQTLRDLMKRAQETQIELQLETKAGEEWRGYPQKLEVDMGYWFVTMESDRKKCKLRLDDIARVKMLLPSYV